MSFKPNNKFSFETIVDEIEKNNLDIINIPKFEKNEMNPLVKNHEETIPPYINYDSSLILKYKYNNKIPRKEKVL